jgi:hypothetical protein
MSANDKNLEVNVSTTRGTKQFSFPKQTKVEEVLRQVIAALGFAAGDSFQLVLAENTSEPLRPERTLVSYHVADGATLILTAVGSGV